MLQSEQWIEVSADRQQPQGFPQLQKGSLRRPWWKRPWKMPWKKGPLGRPCLQVLHQLHAASSLPQALLGCWLCQAPAGLEPSSCACAMNCHKYSSIGQKSHVFRHSLSKQLVRPSMVPTAANNSLVLCCQLVCITSTIKQRGNVCDISQRALLQLP